MAYDLNTMLECEEGDLNTWTPAGTDPKSVAFDLARQSSLKKGMGLVRFGGFTPFYFRANLTLKLFKLLLKHLFLFFY